MKATLAHSKALQYHLVPARATPRASIIWLHGLGADGKDFMPIIDQLQLAGIENIRFLFPNAPMRPITINQGMMMRGWYDIIDLQLNSLEDRTGILESAALITALLQQEQERGIAADKIILAGFSQGGAMALFAGLRFPQRLGGIVALSTYLPLQASLEQEAHQANRTVALYQAHGLFDPIVPLSLGQQTQALLTTQGYTVTWETYPIQHTVSFEEIIAIGKFINNTLKLQ